ncbi:MAG: glycine zipper family protein [Verrucomicrobiales bacterium]|nr:glycine zipper family protein [Verrucomicrobiales bacterium]
MKKTLLALLAGATLHPTQAQLFSPEALSGAALGAIIGGLAGADCRDSFSGNGAAIGAGIGLVAGAIAGEARRYEAYNRPVYDCAPAAEVSFGYGYRSCGSAAYVWYAPNRYCAPGWYYRPERRPDYALGGTLLGAASGALIGAGTGDAGLGAAIGAASGLVVGSLAEAAVRERERERRATARVSAAACDPQPAAQTLAPAPTEAASQPRVSRSPTEVTSKPCPTSTYFWTRPPATIPDAPRVPDAPRF